MHRLEHDHRARRSSVQYAGELMRVLQSFTIDRSKDIARCETRRRGRSVRNDISHEYARSLRQFEAVRDFRRNRLKLHAQPAACNDSFFPELVDHGFGLLGADRKGDAYGAAGR